MKIPADSYERIDAAVADEARLHTDLVRDFLADIQVTFPTLVGLLSGLVGTLGGFVVTATLLKVTMPLLVVSVVVLVIVVRRQRGKTALLQRAYVSTTEAYFAYRAERDANLRLSATQERQLQWLLALAVMQKTSIDCVALVKAQPEMATLATAEQVCGRILDTLVEARHVCLKYGADDPTFNLHIFRYVEEDEALVGFARRHGARVAISNRRWRLGNGHAGRCFEDGEMMCLPDLQGVEGQGYRRQIVDTDASLYRSVIDVPIFSGDKKWGVLCITSGTPDQFSKGDFAPLNVVAATIGVVVTVTS